MTANESDTTATGILGLGRAFMRAKALLSAVELDLFTELAKGPLTAEELCERLGLHRRGARDFFDALVALGLLVRHDGRYANTPATDRFLDRSKPTYVGATLEQANTLQYPACGTLTSALRTGRPHLRAGADADDWQARYRDPEYVRVFATAMTAQSLGWPAVMAETFPWERHRTFADVGTAEGALPVRLALAHPHLNGIGFDLPPLGSLFDDYVASFGLGARLRFQAGDFLADPLPSADVLVLSGILHSWDLDRRLMLLRKAYAALPPGGALIVREVFLDAERRHDAGVLLFGLNMLLNTEGGGVFTEGECRTWMAGVGFEVTAVEPLGDGSAMIVGVK